MRRPEKCSKAGTVDAPVTDPFALEDQVATAVATALGLELKADETRELAFHGTTMPDAYNYYTQARGYLQDASKTADVDSAIILLEQALKVDPNYGRAEADLGSAYWAKIHLEQRQESDRKVPARVFESDWTGQCRSRRPCLPGNHCQRNRQV